MDRLYSVQDICVRYQCTKATARKYMRDMEHMESPLMVAERAVVAWERSKTLPPESTTRQLLRKGVRK